MRFLFHLWLLALVLALTGCAGSADGCTYQLDERRRENRPCQGSLRQVEHWLLLPAAKQREFHQLMRRRYGLR